MRHKRLLVGLLVGLGPSWLAAAAWAQQAEAPGPVGGFPAELPEWRMHSVEEIRAPTELGHPVAIDIQDLNRAGRLPRRERVERMRAQTSRDLP